METTEFYDANIMYSANSGAIIKLEAAPMFSEPVKQNEIKTFPWAPWGNSDRDGQEWANKVHRSSVLGGGISGKARIAIGRGVRPVIITAVNPDGTEEMEFVNDPEIEYWMEQNHTLNNSIAAVRSLLGWGWVHSRFILDNNGKKIARYETTDIVKCRMGRKNENTGQIEKTFYSPNFETAAMDSKKGNYLKEFDMLQEKNELFDLQEYIAINTPKREFSMIYRGDLDGNDYYPYPMWYSAMDWIDMVIKVPKMKVAMMNNEITVKYVITISPKYFEQGDPKWNKYTGAQRQEKFREKAAEINKHLSGTDNAYKSIVSGSYVDPVSGKEIDMIRITVLDDKIKDGKLLVDSGAANKEILFSLMLNPAIMGANTFGGDYSGGAGSGSDIREAYLVQIMLMESERHMNNNVFNIVKHINGWVDKYPGKNLQFRYPNSVLTTLDKGGSLAPAK